MKIAESILDLILLVVPLIIKYVNNKEESIKRFRLLFDKIEAKNESVDLLNSAEQQAKELLNESKDN